MSNIENKKLYEKLELVIDKNNILYHALLSDKDPRGSYDRKYDVIRIFRPTRWDNYTDEDLFVLSHEMGHRESFKNGFHCSKYKNVTDRLKDLKDYSKVSKLEKYLIFKEEILAWIFGAIKLKKIGFSGIRNWIWFLKYTIKSLQKYQDVMELDKIDISLSVINNFIILIKVNIKSYFYKKYLGDKKC